MNRSGWAVRVGSPERLEAYRKDTDALLAVTRPTPTVLPIGPPLLDPSAEAGRQSVAAILDDVASMHPHAVTSDKVTADLSLNGRHVERLPCLPSEVGRSDCVSGMIVVRTQAPAPDQGIHLCPSGLPAGSAAICPNYSSGEVRFSAALVAAIESASVTG